MNSRALLILLYRRWRAREFPLPAFAVTPPDKRRRFRPLLCLAHGFIALSAEPLLEGDALALLYEQVGEFEAAGYTWWTVQDAPLVIGLAHADNTGVNSAVLQLVESTDAGYASHVPGIAARGWN